MKIVNAAWKLIEKIVYVICNCFFHIFKKEIPQSTYQGLIQFVKFGIVGVSNTFISYVVYAVSLMLFQRFDLFPKIDYVISQVIQFLLSVLWSFYWNNKMVFTLEKGKTRSLWKSLFKTYVSYSFTGLFLSSVLLVFWVQLLGVSEFIAPILNLLVTVPINFLINKFWAFRQKEKE